MTNLERLMKAWDKADKRSRLDFLSFLDQWQAMRREEIEAAKERIDPL